MSHSSVQNPSASGQSPRSSSLSASFSHRQLLLFLGASLATSSFAPNLVGVVQAQNRPTKSNAGLTSVALCDLDISLMDQEWNVAQRNRSVSRKPLMVAGRSFVHGVGTHANSILNVRLNGGTKLFTARVGVDDGTTAQATVRFVVMGDGKELWQSEVLKKGDAAVPVKVDVSGVQYLTLRVDNGGDDKSGDHADWGEAVLEGVTKEPIAIARTPDEQNVFLPGRAWLDTSGKPIQAHGGGVMRHGNKWWWYGEDRSNGYVAIGVSAYSSTDLLNWKNEGVVLPKSAYSAKHGEGTICERPKVIYNPTTKKFVMWFHFDRTGYRDSRAGVAIADSPQGPYQYLGQHRPVETGTYRDMNVFVDDDGHAYSFYASEENYTMHIVRLNADWTAPEQPMVQGKTWERVLVRNHREAPAPFKYKGKYYLITSAATGWDANAANMAVADNILGPWTPLGNPCVGPQANLTFESQSTYVLPMPGAPEGSFIFMADRWKPQDLKNSRYVWLPFRMAADPTQTKIEWTPRWTLESARKQ